MFSARNSSGIDSRVDLHSIYKSNGKTSKNEKEIEIQYFACGFHGHFLPWIKSNIILINQFHSQKRTENMWNFEEWNHGYASSIAHFVFGVVSGFCVSQETRIKLNNINIFRLNLDGASGFNVSMVLR